MASMINNSPLWGRPWSTLAANCAGPEGLAEMEYAQDKVANIFATLVQREMGFSVRWDWRRSELWGVEGEFVPAGGEYLPWVAQGRVLRDFRRRAYNESAPADSRIVASFML